MVETLLGGRVSPITTALVSFVVAAGRSRNLPEIIDKLVAQAAEERHEAVAEVRTAYPLDDDPHPSSSPTPSAGLPASTFRSR